MVYRGTTVKPVIANIIRTARLRDMTYADSMLEWIAEGLNRMRIRWRLEKAYQVVTVKNHLAPLPCGLVTLSAVIYNGGRLRKGTSSVDSRVLPWKHVENDLASYFVTDTTIQAEDINSQNINLIRGVNIKQADQYVLDPKEFYQLKLNHIQTSFKEGTIILCYTKQELDKDNYPLIPDIAEARTALMWYVLAQLCIGGYKLPDPKMDHDYCDARAEKFFRKAKNIMRTLSEDEKESAVQLLNNLIPPQTYYEEFFAGAEQRKYVHGG